MPQGKHIASKCCYRNMLIRFEQKQYLQIQDDTDQAGIFLNEWNEKKH